MSEIYINDAADRNHQIIRNEILKYMGRMLSEVNLNLRWILKSTLKKSTLIDSSGEAKRMQLEVEVEYKIFRVTEFREMVFSNTARV